MGTWTDGEMNETQTPDSPWPNRCQGAVSLTFDDGRKSQIERALPILVEHGLLATFYLNPRGKTEEEWCQRLQPWRAVQVAGHEIGNHSLSHVCSQGHRDRRDPSVPSLETWTLADVEADVLEAERRLNAELPMPNGAQRSFCYPCYHEHVGEGPTRQSYVPVIARHFGSGRGMGELENRPATCDLHYLWSWPAEGMDQFELCGRAERAVLNRWVILTFHDIGDSRLGTADHAFQALCAFLARHRERIWTAPVGVAAQRIRTWRESQNGSAAIPAQAGGAGSVALRA